VSRSIQIRVEDDLKKKSDLLFKELGTDTTSAIRMFLTQAVANNGFPFALKKITIDPYMTFAEDEVLKRLEASRQHAAEGKVRDADDVISDMKQKYGIYCYKDHSNRGDQFRYTR
jgi:addiction module antitoxin, relB/dinJ family